MSTDDIDQIARLFKLREAGALTDDEFQTEKSRVLSNGATAFMAEQAAHHVSESAGYATQHEAPDDTADERHRAPWNGSSMRPLIGGGLAAAVVLVGGALVYAHQTTPDEKNLPEATAAPLVGEESPTTAPRVLSEKEILKQAFTAGFGRRVGRYKPQKLVPVGSGTYAVVATASGGQAHSDAGRLAVAYVMRSNDTFAPMGLVREVETGSWGQVPEWKLRGDLGSVQLILVEGGGTWQGCTSSTSTIIELAPSSPNVLGSVPVSYSYEDEDGALTEYSGTIETGPDGLQVRYTGSINQVIPLSTNRGALTPGSPLPKVC